jgi:hypothetical protein
VEDAKKYSREVFILGGEECVPLLEWDSVKICNERGPLAKLF